MTITMKHLLNSLAAICLLACSAFFAPAAIAADPEVPAVPAATTPHVHQAGGEVNIVLPDFTGKEVDVKFLGSFSGQQLLMIGLIVCMLGLCFAMMIYMQLKGMAVHKSMLDISELIYETCKAYLLRQGKFLLVLWAFVAFAMLAYFKFLVHVAWGEMALIIIFSLIGIAGSYGVAWFGIRVNTFANSRAAFGSLRGKPWP